MSLIAGTHQRPATSRGRTDLTSAPQGADHKSDENAGGAAGGPNASCYNPAARVRTPHIDHLAQAGLQFTDAHSPATVCTPSRYGLLTGQMPFRIPQGGVVFTGTGGPALIAPGRLTLARMLQQQGYATWAVGKWHLGLTFRDAAGQPLHDDRPETVARIDFSRPVEGGPLEHGFDRFYGTACCPTTDWWYAFIDGDRIPVAPTTLLDKSRLPGHAWSHDCRAGLIAPNFPMESIDQVFLQQRRRILKEHWRPSHKSLKLNFPRMLPKTASASCRRCRGQQTRPFAHGWSPRPSAGDHQFDYSTTSPRQRTEAAPAEHP